MRTNGVWRRSPDYVIKYAVEGELLEEKSENLFKSKTKQFSKFLIFINYSIISDI